MVAHDSNKKCFLALSAIICITLIVTSCASQPEEPPVAPDWFSTNISVQGNKQFSFSIGIIVGDKDKHSHMKLNGGPMPEMGKALPESKGPKPDNSSMLHERLEVKLAETGYCREGYTEIDTYQTDNRMNLIGECKETATEQDRVFFVNRYGY